MTLTALLNMPVTITRRADSGALDEFGNDINTETSIETVGELQQRQRSEPGQAGELSIADFLLILPADTPLGTGDQVIADGQAYEVTGDPWRARNPRTGVFSHIEATVRRTSTSGDEGAS